MMDLRATDVFDRMIEAVACYARDGAFLYSNPANCSLIGRAPAEVVGHNVWSVLGDTLGREFRAAFERVASSGHPEHIDHFYPDAQRWYTSQLFSASGRVWVIGRDTTESAVGAQQLGALAAASRAFTAALSEAGGGFDLIAQHIAGVLSGGCTLRLLSEDGARFEAPVGSWDSDPAVAAVLRRASPLPLERGGAMALARSGQCLRANAEPRAALELLAPQDRGAAERLGIHSAMLVRVDVQGQLVALLSVYQRSKTPAEYTERDRSLAEELARRAALVIAERRSRHLMQESRRRLLLIGDALPALVSMVSGDLRYQFVNATYESWFGRPPSDVVGRTMGEVLGEAAFTAIEPHVRKVLGGEVVTYEARVPYLTGGERDILATYTPYGTGFEVEGFIALVMDVSDRVRLLRELQAGERRMNTIFENAPFAILLAKMPSGEISKINEAYVRLFEYSREELIGRTTFELETQRNPAIRRRMIQELQARGSVRGAEMQVTAKSGRALVVSVNADLVEVDGEPHALATFQDITLQKQSEQALRDSESKFRALADNMSQLAWMADATGARVWFNRRWFEYTGKALHEVQGWGWQELYSPEHRASVVEEYRTAIARGEPWTVTQPLLGKSGQYRWFLTQVVPVRDESGTVVRWFGTKTDVTDEREAEDTLRRAVQLRNEFLSVASHELRTPLTALSLQLEGLQRLLGRRPDDGSERASKKLDIALKQTLRLATLVDGLLNVSRLSSGRLELQPEHFDLGNLVSDIVERTGELASRAEVEVRVDRRGDLEGTWDRTRLEQVIVNLLDNAIKYGRGAPVDLVVEASGDFVGITVRDQGIGISAADQRRIFERFERAVPAKHYGGLGLGLYVAHQIVVAHGGEILVHSAPGGGAAFTVRLPRTIPHATVERWVDGRFPQT